MNVLTQNPVAPTPADRESARDLKRLLASGAPTFVTASGERVAVPPTLHELLKNAAALMEDGMSVTLMPENQFITTQRAANLLGMSRPFFIKLLESGAMAHHRVGNQRRVRLWDVLEFARKRDEERDAALDRLSRQAFEAGLYDRNVIPKGASAE